MKKLFECRLVPRVVGPISLIDVRVEGVESYVKCLDLLAQEFPEYEIVHILEGYQRDGRPSGETG